MDKGSCFFFLKELALRCPIAYQRVEEYRRYMHVLGAAGVW